VTNGTHAASPKPIKRGRKLGSTLTERYLEDRSPDFMVPPLSLASEPLAVFDNNNTWILHPQSVSFVLSFV